MLQTASETEDEDQDDQVKVKDVAFDVQLGVFRSFLFEDVGASIELGPIPSRLCLGREEDFVWELLSSTRDTIEVLSSGMLFRWNGSLIHLLPPSLLPLTFFSRKTFEGRKVWEADSAGIHRPIDPRHVSLHCRRREQ